MNRVSAHYVSVVINACCALGAVRDQLTCFLPDGEASIVNPMARLDDIVLVKIYEHAANHLNEPNIGLKVGAQFDVSTNNQTGKLLPLCETFGEAVSMLSRYHLLTQSFGWSKLAIQDSTAFLNWNMTSENFEKYKHITEAIYAGLTMGGKWLLWKSDRNLDAVHFRHKAHGHTKLYEDVLGCPVYFEKSTDALVFPVGYLDIKLASANPDMRDKMIQQLDDLMIETSEASGLIDRTKASIRNQLTIGVPKLEVTAKDLGLTQRNLRHKLSLFATSFREIVEMERKAICETELREGKRMSQIAQKLGFHDQSAFNRAFKKWYGVPPRQYQLSHSAALGAK